MHCWQGKFTVFRIQLHWVSNLFFCYAAEKQISRFGDNILKRGTIVDGCNFSFYNNYPYVKLVDLQKDGQTAIPSSYVTYRRARVDQDKHMAMMVDSGAWKPNTPCCPETITKIVQGVCRSKLVSRDIKQFMGCI